MDRLCKFCGRELTTTEGHLAVETISGRHLLCHLCMRAIVQQFVSLVLPGPASHPVASSRIESNL